MKFIVTLTDKRQIEITSPHTISGLTCFLMDHPSVVKIDITNDNESFINISQRLNNNYLVSISPDVLQQVRVYIDCKNKVDCVKYLRKVGNLSLAEAVSIFIAIELNNQDYTQPFVAAY